MTYSASGSEFDSNEFLWNSPDDVYPSSELDWSHNHQSASALIDSCAKAKVVAVMALELLAFDGKLHGSRSNWACPFGDCKANFADAKTLMRHVPSCTHFTGGGKVYCNNCDGRDCFPVQGDCRDDFGDGSVAHSDVEPTKKRNTIRKITSMLSRSLPGSRRSSQASARTNDPSPVAGPHKPPPAVIPTYSPKGWSPGRSPEASERRQGVGSGSGWAAPQEMDCTQRPAELPETTATPQELPAHEQLDQCYFSGGVFTESPVEDLAMDTRMGGLYPTSNHTSASFRATEMPQAKPSSATAPWFPPPALDTSQRHQLSPEFTQRTVSPLSTSTVGGRMYSFPDDSVSNYSIPIGNVNVNESDPSAPFHSSSLLQAALPRPPLTPTRSRAWQGSGDTWSSTFSSSNTLVPQHSEPQLRIDKGKEVGPSLPMAGPFPSPPCPTPAANFPAGYGESVATEDLTCPDCDFRPTGQRSNWRMYLKKHISRHRARKIPCPDCGKEFSRMDNRKTHQKNSCPGTRSAAIPPQPLRRPVTIRGREMVHPLDMRRTYPPSRRKRGVGTRRHQNYTESSRPMVSGIV